jgi:folate-binding protein YgfZ
MIYTSTRTLITLTGPEAPTFLNGLITQDIRTIQINRSGFCAFLTPQGRYITDAFIKNCIKNIYWLDIPTEALSPLLAHLNRYKLRSKVTINHKPDYCIVYLNSPHPEAYPDHTGLMRWRYIAPTKKATKAAPEQEHNWRLSQIKSCISSYNEGLTPNKSIILDHGFNTHKALSWTKGCYMGQELMARTHHRGVVRKTLACLQHNEICDTNDTALLTANKDKKIGTILCQGTETNTKTKYTLTLVYKDFLTDSTLNTNRGLFSVFNFIK